MWGFRGRKKTGARAIATSAARSLRSHPVPTLTANLNRDDLTKQRIATALTILVGVVQDFMAVSGYTLSAAVRTAITTNMRAATPPWVSKMVAVTGALAGATGMGAGVSRATGPLAGAGRGLARATGADRLLWKFTVHLVYLFWVKSRGGSATKASLERFMKRSKGNLAALMQGKDIDLRPLVSDLVMSMDYVDVGNAAATIVDDILREYVHNPYTPTSTGGSVMCTLCSSVRCVPGGRNNGSSQKAGTRGVHGERLADLAARALKALNMVLKLQGTTVTRVLRAASSTYTQQWAGIKKRPLAPLMTTGVEALGASVGATVLAANALLFGVIGQRPYLARYLAAFGVDISQASLTWVVTKHSVALSRFLAWDPTVNIEPMLLDILRRTDPIGATRGVLSAAVARKGSSEFCHLCFVKYTACV